MTKKMYDEASRTGWKLNPKDHEHRGWTYYKDGKARDDKGKRFSDDSRFSETWLKRNYKRAWNELFIRPTGKLMNRTIGSEFIDYNEKTDKWKLKPYRDNPLGGAHNLASLTIRGVTNVAKNIADRFTYEPGSGKKKTVHDTKQDLKIEKEKITQELINELGGK